MRLFLTHIEQSFNILNMRSAPDDLTPRAVIRDTAIRLFAEHGPDATSLRRIATEAGVSAALVVHHFGSKAGLREAVDAHVAATFEGLFDAPDEDVAAMLAGESTQSFAEIFVRSFPAESHLPAYLRRLMLSQDPAGRTIFRHWFEQTRLMLDEMTHSGLVSQSQDPPVRAAFLLVNDLALVLLHQPIAESLGFDPLSQEGLGRWIGEATAVYRQGMFAAEGS